MLSNLHIPVYWDAFVDEHRCVWKAAELGSEIQEKVRNITTDERQLAHRRVQMAVEKVKKDHEAFIPYKNKSFSNLNFEEREGLFTFLGLRRDSWYVFLEKYQCLQDAARIGYIVGQERTCDYDKIEAVLLRAIQFPEYFAQYYGANLAELTGEKRKKLFQLLKLREMDSENGNVRYG